MYIKNDLKYIEKEYTIDFISENKNYMGVNGVYIVTKWCMLDYWDVG